MKKIGSLSFKTTGGILALLAVFAILVAINILAGTVRLRVDLTEEGLYTLSEGSRKILKELDQEVALKFFFSSSVPEAPIPLKTFADKVGDFLTEYEVAGNGKILVQRFDPKPDSDAADDAERFGLSGQMMGISGNAIYLGLAAVAGDEVVTSPFLNPSSEQLLEYTITRMIYTATHPKRATIGVLSPLPVLGTDALPFAMPGQPRPQPQPAWIAFSTLEQDYEVEEIPTDTDGIDEDIDLLVLAHPKDLGKKTLYAIDQFLLRGGRLIAFVDPMCISDPGSAAQRYGGERGSDLNPLLKAWGLSQEKGKIVADQTAMTRISTGEGKVEDSPAFLSLTAMHLDRDDVVTARLESMLLPFATAFSGEPKEGLTLTTLAQSSEDSALISSVMAQMGSRAIQRDFQKSLKNLNLAVRLHGTFESAFPDGKPIEEDQDGDEPDTDTDAEEKTEHLQKSTAPGTVVLVGDVDMLNDRFCVREIKMFFGMTSHQRLNDNLNFFWNTLEQLTGSQDLIGIRSRGQFARPFDRVIALQREAQARWMEKENALQEKLQATSKRLSDLQSEKDQSQQFILSPSQQREIERFQKEKSQCQRELKQVRKELSKEIERLGMKVKAINTLLMPLLISLGGVAFSVYRRTKLRK